MKFSALLAVSVLLGCTFTAQEPTERPDSPRVHADGIEVLVVAENPFSGRYSIDSSHSLDDGSVQTTHVETTVARDSQGRVYLERHNLAPCSSDQQSSLTNFFILDPVAHTRTSCNVTARRGDITRFRGVSLLRPIPAIALLRARVWEAMLFMVSTSLGHARPSRSEAAGPRRNGRLAPRNSGI